jgi:hypothetical protein
MSHFRSRYAVSRCSGCWLCCSRRFSRSHCFSPRWPLRRMQSRSNLQRSIFQGFIAVSEDMAKLYDGANPDIVVSLDCGSACRHDGTAEWREPCALVSEYQIRHAI